MGDEPDHQQHEGADLLEKLGPALAAVVAVAVAQRVAAVSSAQLAQYVAPIAALLSAVAVYVLSRLLPSTMLAQAAGLVGSLVVLVLGGAAVSWLIDYSETGPGRSARELAAEWETIVADDFLEETRIDQEDGEYGTGYGETGNGRLLLAGQSEISHAVPWPLYPELSAGSDFYVEVTAKLTSGPEDIGCGIMFAWQDAESWWGFRLVDSDRVIVSRFEGRRNDRIDARTFYGPTPAGFGDIRTSTRLGVLVFDDVFTFMVNDREVIKLDRDVLLDPSGSVAPFAIDSSSLYRASYRCQFQHLRVFASAPQ